MQATSERTRPTDPAPALRRIAVFRARPLGDLLEATPALRALRRGHPQAHITLVGQPWARSLAARLASVDDFLEFPAGPGLALRGFDLTLQLDGNGVSQLLAHTDRLMLARQGLHLDFPLRDGDREAAERLAAPLRGRKFALLHPGAPSPAWADAAERLARAADALAQEGLAVVLTGSAAEAPFTRAVAQAMHAPALDLAGRTTLWSLGALVEWAVKVVGNDAGILRVAEALGTPHAAPATPPRHLLLPPVGAGVAGSSAASGRSQASL